MPIRDTYKENGKKFINAEEIYGKEFGQRDQGGQTSQTWRNREIDWYNAERRFLFSAKTEKEAFKFMQKVKYN